MSKASAIIFCHFILLGSFSLATLDREQAWPEERQPAASSPPLDPDIVEVFRQSLTEERTAHEELQQHLTQAQEALRQRDKLLATGDARTREALANLQRTEAEAQKLAESQSLLEEQRLLLEAQLARKETNLTRLERRVQTAETAIAVSQREKAALRSTYDQVQLAYQSARNEVSRLETELANALSEAKVSAEVIRTLQEDLRKQVAVSGQLQERVQGPLKPAGKEKRPGRDTDLPPTAQLQLNQGERLNFPVAPTRGADSPMNLAGNVAPIAPATTLRSSSGTEDFQAGEGMLNELNLNRVQANLQARRTGLFGQIVRKEAGAKAILISNRGQLYALCHVEDIPLVLEPVPADWDGLTGTLVRGTALLSITQVSFLDRDPRVVVIPLSQAQAEQLRCKVFAQAADPSRSEDGILIGTTRPYYAEVKIQPDPATARYVRLARDRWGRVSGKFSPARGDVLMSRAGEVLGLMVNKEYCLLLDDLTCTRSINTGAAFQQPSLLLVELYQQLVGLPHRLQ